MSLPTLDDDNREKKNVGLPSIDMPPIDDSDDIEIQKLPIEDELKHYPIPDPELHEEMKKQIEELKEESSPSEENSTPPEDGDDYHPEYEEELKSEEESKGKFIDKKNKKIVPFGGKKSKKKKKLVKSSDFDDRKNKLAKTKIMQVSIIFVMIILFLLGLKNTFMPSHVYTDEQIRQFAAEGAGQTGFPEERGEAYVESFMETYLTFDKTKPEYLERLSYFYGQRLSDTENSQINSLRGYHAKQHIIIAPRVFEVDLLSEYSAQYKVTSYVSDVTGEEAADGKSAGRWLSFAVNVYYDKKGDSLIITPDSPSIIPAYKITNQTSVPQRRALGDGALDREILPALTPTIHGYIEAYAKSSVDSHESILQYISDKDDISLYSGFGGSVKLKGEPSESIKKVAYTGTDGIYRVDVTVTWVDAKTSKVEDLQTDVEYTSRYIMRIIPIADGKYAVSSFVPYTYLK